MFVRPTQKKIHPLVVGFTIVILGVILALAVVGCGDSSQPVNATPLPVATINDQPTMPTGWFEQVIPYRGKTLHCLIYFKHRRDGEARDSADSFTGATCDFERFYREP